jgi:murein L,D-transpeptidase YcbB/YkuD
MTRRPYWQVLLVALAIGGCDARDTETRAREAAEKIKASIPDVEAAALEQRLPPGDVKMAQEVLTKLDEYQGEITGKLDLVTVNAIQAFQRTNGFKADGLLTAETKDALRAAAAGKAPE